MALNTINNINQLIYLAILSSVYAIATESPSIIGDQRRYRELQIKRLLVHQGGYVHRLEVSWGLLQGSETRFKELFRLERDTFKSLFQWLRDNTEIPVSRCQTLDQKVRIFLLLCDHGVKQRVVAHLCKVSQSSVSRAVQVLLELFRQLHIAFIKQPGDSFMSPDIELCKKKNTFSGCIGAINGTHVAARVPVLQQHRFFNRKAKVTQNALAAARIDWTFSYILAGAEGSLRDASLMRMALSRRFSVPEARFYHGDAGFSIQKGILVPYTNVCYHLDDWNKAANKPQTPEELYNPRHARIRIVVKQTFRRLKRKFAILRDNPAEYSFNGLVRIVYAITGLWNFIQASEEDELAEGERGVIQRAQEAAQLLILPLEGRELRDHMRDANWESYQEYLSQGDRTMLDEIEDEGSGDGEGNDDDNSIA